MKNVLLEFKDDILDWHISWISQMLKSLSEIWLFIFGGRLFTVLLDNRKIIKTGWSSCCHGYCRSEENFKLKSKIFFLPSLNKGGWYSLFFIYFYCYIFLSYVSWVIFFPVKEKFQFYFSFGMFVLFTFFQHLKNR